MTYVKQVVKATEHSTNDMVESNVAKVLFIPLLQTMNRSVKWLAGDVKESTHLSKRVRHVDPGVEVWPCLKGWCFT